MRAVVFQVLSETGHMPSVIRGGNWDRDWASRLEMVGGVAWLPKLRTMGKACGVKFLMFDGLDLLRGSQWGAGRLDDGRTLNF